MTLLQLDRDASTAGTRWHPAHDTVQDTAQRAMAVMMVMTIPNYRTVTQ